MLLCMCILATCAFIASQYREKPEVAHAWDKMCCTNNDRQLSPSLRQQREPCYTRSDEHAAQWAVTGLCFNGWEWKNNFNHFSQQFKVSSSCSCEIISAGCWSGSGVKSGGLYFCSFFLVINDLFMDVYIDWLLFWWRRAVKYRTVFTSGPGWTDYLWSRKNKLPSWSLDFWFLGEHNTQLISLRCFSKKPVSVSLDLLSDSLSVSRVARSSVFIHSAGLLASLYTVSLWCSSVTLTSN